MKRYTILCKEITGARGKILNNGEVHAESEFVPGHVEEHLKNKHIEEYKEPAVVDEKKK